MDKFIFHLAFPIKNIETAKKFYGDILGAKVGRENPLAIILNFYGHQLVGHITEEDLTPPKNIYPRHFGIIFNQESDFEDLLTRCQKHNLEFYQPLKSRFKGELTEHKTFFLQDPFYNILEFKYYVNYEAIFGANQLLFIGDR